MNCIKNVLFYIIICQISRVIKGVKIKVINLNTWNLSNENGTIRVDNLKSPTGVYSALQDSYGDILESKNDDLIRWMSYDNWTFSTFFSATFDSEQRVNLTLHGIDTVSIVYFNNYEIGKTENMFVRYSFDITPYLRHENILEIQIISPVLIAKARAKDFKKKGINAPPDCPHSRINGECHRNMLRKMQASFGSKSNVAAPSMGIWKPVVLEFYEVAIMRDVDVAIRRNNVHWTLDMRIFLSSDTKQKFYCEVTFIAVQLLDEALVFKREISHDSLKIDFKVDIPKEKVQLWWPNGYGEQKLYPLHFISNCWLNRAGPRIKSRTKSEKTIDIGFRTIELVEDLDDYGRAFYFKVNGQPIFVKGANYVPSHILPDYSYRENTLLHLMKAAKETHLNMIRVWGGGLYESDTFYNLTDFYGILVWQDLAFTGSTYPLTDSFLDSIRIETSQNARRLAFHPSLCILVTNDEIELYLATNKTELGSDFGRLGEEYRYMFMETIRHELNVISRDDFNPRAGPMISTPSMGVEASNAGLSLEPQNPNYGDIHFCMDDKDGWDPDIYPRARFITKYGFQSLPILSSWNRTMHPNENLAEIVQHRQHNPKGFIPMFELISRHFAWSTMDWENNIETLIYLSQLSQAIATKTATDVFRSHRIHKRTMGSIYWHLNDNWVAPTSSSIDYFGNYKIVWHWSKEFMAPTAIIALMDVKNSKINVTITKEKFVEDSKKQEKFNITMYSFLWSHLYHRRSITWETSVGSNGINTEYLDMNALFTQPFTRDNCFFKFVLTQHNETISSTILIPGKIYNSNGLTDPQLNYGVTTAYCLKANKVQYHTITITVKRPALFVYIEIYHPAVERYKLSENGIIITEPIKAIHLQIDLKSPECFVLEKSYIRIKTVNDLSFGNTTTYNASDVEHKAQMTTTKGIDTSSKRNYEEVALNINDDDVKVNTI